jgi:tryptophanase
MRPIITQAMIDQSKFLAPEATFLLMYLKAVGRTIATETLSAGATGVTTKQVSYIAPTNLKIKSIKATIMSVNTGTSNEPTVDVKNGANIVGQSAVVALGGAVGDDIPIVINPLYVNVAQGSAISFEIVNPSATITTPLKVKIVIDCGPG